MRNRYYISLPEPAALAAAGAFAFRSHGAAGIADELQAALRTDALFRRWAATQDDPDEIENALAAVDPEATVTGEQNDLRIDLVVTTGLSSAVLKHRLQLLAGRGWQLRDVTAA